MVQNNTYLEIKKALSDVSSLEYITAIRNILSILGYESERELDLSGCPFEFISRFSYRKENTQSERDFLDQVKSVKLVFQYTNEEIISNLKMLNFYDKNFNEGDEKSFLFFAVELKNNTYSRGRYAKFTREISKRISTAPTVVFLKNSDEKLTISLVFRRKHKNYDDRKVLGDVFLLKEIDLKNPHRAHVEVLEELSIPQLLSYMNKNNKPKNFDGLFESWLEKLNIEELNKRFYGDLLRWYKRAILNSIFPEFRNKNEQIIRLITRILFLWFIKEKELVAEELFNEEQISKYLKNYDKINGDSYYRVILQNLFFATLNTEIETRDICNSVSDNNLTIKYRYKNEMNTPYELEKYFIQSPFINGGLFDCLDENEKFENGKGFIDCFSDDESIHKLISIPNKLFFDKECGLFPMLSRYKFTVEENTPIEQEVALDPELLGRVFEELLAYISIGPNKSQRSKTGSFYTPRQIVEYIVDKSLLETLRNKCKPSDDDLDWWNDRLGYLLDHSHDDEDAQGLFSEEERNDLVRTISKIKVLDPAVGSGAFPVSLLLKLTLILQRLDYDNTIWKKVQGEKIKITNEPNFERKLCLIQNNIYGVDIQPIACQITKLRFFISLIIEQKRNDSRAQNYGIKPLPNLDLHFLSADSLLSLKLHKKGIQRDIFDKNVYEKEMDINLNREKYFHANNQNMKSFLITNDKKLRNELVDLLKNDQSLSEVYKNEIFKIANWDPFDQSSIANWFDKKYMFGIEEGFDIVFGNPPYIQLQNNRSELSHRYKNENYETFISSGDIYCLFIEFGLNILKKSGHLCFITSNKWMRAKYGTKLIQLLTKSEWNKILLVDFGGIKVFESATVDTSIVLISKEKSNHRLLATKITEDFKEKFDIHEFVSKRGITMKNFDNLGSGPIFIGTDKENELKEKIENIGTPLKEWDISINLGIKTGYNDAFIINSNKKTS